LKIRSHLLLLAAGALLPLLVFAVVLTAHTWRLEQGSVEVRQLEHVHAMTIALDTELQASIRALRVLELAPSLEDGPIEDSAERMRAVLSVQPLWSALAVGDPQWREAVGVTHEGIMASPPAVDERTRHRALMTRMPAVSPLLSRGGKHQTQIVVPVRRETQVALLMVVAIDPAAWLEFMGRYPVGPGAVMALIDQDGLIIARTLDNERWVGQKLSPGLLRKSREVAEATYRNVTLEGVTMYAAHSRSVPSGWTVAAGIPAATVDAALRGSTLMLLGAATLSVVLAVLLTLFFGGRIARPVIALGEAAHALAHGFDPPAPPQTGPIDEVREVADAFDKASAMLRERQRALNDALQGEQRARREAEQASAAKDEFLAMLGHELRNPLNAVAGAVAVLQQPHPTAEQSQRAREIIGRQVVGLRELVDDLLDMARVTSGKIALERRTTDLAPIARRTVMVMSGAGRLAGHTVDVDCEEAWVCGDETRLEQIVSNLLDNAAKYTPPGGRIAVRVRAENGQAVLEVEDSGVGISPELLPRIFDLFTQGERTLDRSQGGLGLGLALVRRLAELHGGTVSAYSGGPGSGATFQVRLDLQPAPAASAVAESPEAIEKKLRILIVDDNPDGRESLAMMLGMQGHEVHEAVDGPSAVQRALELVPDAAIVDIGLPGFDGYEVARRVRAAAKGAAIRLVALTGYGQEEDRRAALAAGFDSYLVKPADLNALHSILGRV